MSAPVLVLHDGLSPSAPVRKVGRHLIQFPFRVNRDFASRLLVRQYKALNDYYVPPPLGPLTRDDVYNDHVLLLEDDGTLSPLNVLKFSRTYGPVPLDQVYEGRSVVVTKPNPSVIGSPNVHFFTDAFVSFAGTCYTYLNYVFGANKVYGPFQVTTSADSGANTRVTFPLAHGLSNSGEMLASNNGFYGIFPSGTFNVVDPLNVDLLGHNYGAFLIGGAPYFRAYTPGTDEIGGRLTQKFYLAGETPRINDNSDIPRNTPLSNDAIFLSAVLGLTDGYLFYSAKPPTPWPAEKSPVLMREITEINSRDL